MKCVNTEIEETVFCCLSLPQTHAATFARLSKALVVSLTLTITLTILLSTGWLQERIRHDFTFNVK